MKDPASGRPGGEELSWRLRLMDSWREGGTPFFYLRPLAWLYGLGAALRRGLLPKISPPVKAGVPVVSFGNLTVGGSGKTPMTLTLGRLLLDKGFKPAVLSRGYGRDQSLRPSSLIVSQGQGPLVSVEESGDEPWMMAQELPGLIVVVDADRVQGARTAKELGANFIILDDGFQQLNLAIDCRVLLIPAQEPFGNRAVLPAGPLRERLSAHKAADIIVTTGAGQPADQARSLAGARPLFAAEYKALGWRALRDPYRKPLEFMAGRKVMVFCGLGRPDGFRRTLAPLELDIRRFLSFEDHQVYDRATLNEIGYNLMDCGAEVLVTTAKDAVKIPPDFPLPLVYLQMRMELDRSEDFIQTILAKLPASPV